MSAVLIDEAGRDMFDTMTLTKAVGGFCGTFLVFLLGGWAAESIYSAPKHHGEGEVHQAYVIPVESGETEEVVEEGPSFAEAYAMADVAAGEGEFRPCAACHKLVAGENATGPYLYGVVGRPIGAAEGFAYSGALNVMGEAWAPEVLEVFLTNPKEAAPGTTMNYNGIKDVQDRANLIAYLDSLDG